MGTSAITTSSALFRTGCSGKETVESAMGGGCTSHEEGGDLS